MKKGDIRTEAIYKYIKEFVDENGFPPSVREIAEKFNMKSTSTVHYYLEKLRHRGWITPVAKRKRAFSVVQTRSQSVYVPLVGNVSAGTGILAVENIEGEFPLPRDFFSDNDLYMLRVDGDSMINAGIADGDYVVVHSQNSVDLGQIAVVLWQDKATIKRLHATSPNLVLHPENDTMQDIVIPPEDNPCIIGKVVGCVKKF